MAKTLQSDSELARKAAAGDQAAFILLVERHQGMVSGVALSLLKDVSASEDAAQETFLSAWKKMGTLRDFSKLRPWLAAIARNTALTHLRMKKKKAESRALEETMSDSSPGPDQVSAHKDDLSLVLTALETLPEKYRTPLILFYREDQSVAAVAEALGLRQDLVKQRLKRGRDQLRDEVESTLSKTLRRSAPTAVFTASVVTAISALTPTTASAAAGLSLSSVTHSTVPASSAVTIMNSSKISLTVAALLGVAAIPAGYGMRALLTKESTASASFGNSVASVSQQPFDRNSLTIPPSEVVTEWKRLQEEYGDTPEAMHQLWAHIDSLPEGFLKEGLLSVLVTEWVATDPRGGFDFFLKKRERNYRTETAWETAFLGEWLRTDSLGAIAGVKATGKKWGSSLARAAIVLAQQEPDFFIENLEEIALSGAGTDSTEKALLILAEHDHEALRDAAVAARLTTKAPYLEKALGKALRVWATKDGKQALTWVQTYEGEGRDFALSGALEGIALVNPMEALREGLNNLDLRESSSSIHNEFIAIAAAQDLDGTLAWYLEGLSENERMRSFDYAMGSVVAKELSKDPTRFLSRLESQGQLEGLQPAFERMFPQGSFCYRWQEISDWVNARSESAFNTLLGTRVAKDLVYHDPPAALGFVDGLADSQLRNELRKIVAKELMDSPSLDEAHYYRVRNPEWAREFTLAAFYELGSHSQKTGLAQNPLEMDQWLAAAEELDGNDFKNAASHLAVAYFNVDPTAALEWFQKTPKERLSPQEWNTILGNAAGLWIRDDEVTALGWISQQDLGSYHDSFTEKAVSNLSRRGAALDEVWPWFESLSTKGGRKRAFRNLTDGIDRTEGEELVERMAALSIPEEEKSFYLEKLSTAQATK